MQNILLAQILANLTGLATTHKDEQNKAASAAAENGALIQHYTTNDAFKAALDGFIDQAVAFIFRDDAPVQPATPEVTPEAVGEPVPAQSGETPSTSTVLPESAAPAPEVTPEVAGESSVGATIGQVQATPDTTTQSTGTAEPLEGAEPSPEVTQAEPTQPTEV